jgi:hypothetical protein
MVVEMSGINLIFPKSTVPGYALNLNIQGIKQEQPNWCWAATSKIVLSYLGQADPTQTQIVSTIYYPPTNSTVNHTQDGASLTNFGLITTGATSTISWATLKDNISGWYSPIKTEILWTNGNAGHVEVIHGYYENGTTQQVFYEDPLPANPTFNICSYNWYVSNPNWTWAGTYYYSHRP